MSFTIHKYEFPIVDSFELVLPKGADILKVEMQNDIPCMWVLKVLDAKLEKRVFSLFGTGHLIGTMKNRKWIATFQNPPFVWHLFEDAL